MGSCVSSVHKKSESTQTTAMGFRLPFAGSKAAKLVIPSPVKGNDTSDNPLVKGNSGDRTIAADISLKSHWSPPRSVTSFRESDIYRSIEY